MNDYLRFCLFFICLFLIIGCLNAQNFRLTKKPKNPVTDQKDGRYECIGYLNNDKIYFPDDLRLTISLDEGQYMSNPIVNIMVTDIQGNILPSSLIYPISSNPDFNEYFSTNYVHLNETGRIFFVDFNFQCLSNLKIDSVVFYIDIDQYDNPPKTWDYINRFCIDNKEIQTAKELIIGRSSIISQPEKLIRYKVYPNPSKGIFQIELINNDIINYQLSVNSLNGAEVAYHSYQNSKNSITVIIDQYGLNYVVLNGKINNNEISFLVLNKM